MEYRKLGNTDLEVSVIGIGSWALGGDFYGKVDDKKSIEAIREGLDIGINLIDVAPAYGDGHAEKVVGKAIEGFRDKVVLATKCGTYRQGKQFINDLSPTTIRKQMDQSLSRLGVETIDLYQIHWPDENTPLEDSISVLKELKKQGKFKYLGVSNFEIDLLKEITEMTEIVSLQSQYSILNRKIENNLLPFCQKQNIGALTYGSLGGGILTGKYKDKSRPPKLSEDDRRSEFYPYFNEKNWPKVVELVKVLEEIANKNNCPLTTVSLNWLRQQPGISAVLVGVKNVKQVRENASTVDWKLKDTELNRINEAYKKIFNTP